MMTLFSLIILAASAFYFLYKYNSTLAELETVSKMNANLRAFLSVAEEREAADAADYAYLSTTCQGPCDRCGDDEPCEEDALALGFAYDNDGNLTAPLDVLKWNTLSTDGNSAVAYGDDYEDGADDF